MSIARAELPLETVDLNTAIHQAHNDLSLEAEKRQARFEMAPLNHSVLANPASLHLVLVNLISNAIKFVPADKVPHVRAWSEDLSAGVEDGAPENEKYVRLWIQDNGIGIAAEHKDKIFGVFQRLHTRESYPGTGIGLAIVKQAVHRMGGKVDVESEPGKGSLFHVDLRRAVEG